MLNVRTRDVFVDVCTQRDYLLPDGAAPSVNAGTIVPRIKHLMAFARWAGIPTLSCVDARRPGEMRGITRAACVVGTRGQTKLSCTLLPDHVHVSSDNCLCVALDLLQQHQQAVLAKEHRDPFTNPKLDRLLTEMPGRRFIIFGMALEASVRLLALGLMLRHRDVAVVEDACGWWDEEEGAMATRQLAAKGCTLIKSHALIDALAARQKRNGRLPLRSRSVA